MAGVQTGSRDLRGFFRVKSSQYLVTEGRSVQSEKVNEKIRAGRWLLSYWCELCAPVLTCGRGIQINDSIIVSRSVSSAI